MGLAQEASIMPEQLLVVRQGLVQELQTLVSERQRASLTAKPLGKTVDGAGDKIKRLMIDELGLTEVIITEDDGKQWKVTVDPYASKSSISRELLIQAGVAAEIVDACTVTTYYEKIDVRDYKGEAA
jgi:hypothetical protein